MGRPAGSPNKDKPYRDALRRAIARAQDNGSPRALDKIAEAHLDQAASGDMQAIRELADRLDGKVPQAIGGTDELGPVETVVTWKQPGSTE